MSLVSGVSMPGRNSECVLVTKDARALMFGSDSAWAMLWNMVSTKGAHVATALLKWPLP